MCRSGLERCFSPTCARPDFSAAVPSHTRLAVGRSSLCSSPSHSEHRKALESTYRKINKLDHDQKQTMLNPTGGLLKLADSLGIQETYLFLGMGWSTVQTLT